MNIIGKQGEWYLVDDEGDKEGPYMTRQELKQRLEELIKDEEDLVMRLVVERDDNGRIKEVKVVRV